MPLFAEPLKRILTFSESRSLRLSRSLLTPIWRGLMPFVLLWLTACATQQRVKLDPMIPHQISQPATVKVWSVLPDGRAAEVDVDVSDGWWLASPLLIGKQ